jgi:hypothetical protein
MVRTPLPGSGVDPPSTAGRTPRGIIVIDAITKISYIWRSDENEIWSTRSEWFPRLVRNPQTTALRAEGRSKPAVAISTITRIFAVDLLYLQRCLIGKTTSAGRIRGAGRPLLPLLPLEHSALGELGIEMERVFAPPLLRRVVDMNEAKPSAVAERPLEIIEQ